jgi:hypothetical protein
MPRAKGTGAGSGGASAKGAKPKKGKKAADGLHEQTAQVECRIGRVSCSGHLTVRAG